MLTPTVDNPIVNTGTKELIRAGVAENTLRAYRTSIKALDAWLNGRVLTDALLAEYLTELHMDYGRAPATISQVVAAVKWTATDASGRIRRGGATSDRQTHASDNGRHPSRGIASWSRSGRWTHMGASGQSC